MAIHSGSGNRVRAKNPSPMATTPTTPRATWLSGRLVRKATASSRRKAITATTGMTANRERKNTIWPGGTSPDALMNVDMATKAHTAATLSAIPVSGLRSSSSGDGLTPWQRP
jgi:hypothetical protein